MRTVRSLVLLLPRRLRCTGCDAPSPLSAPIVPVPHNPRPGSLSESGLEQMRRDYVAAQDCHRLRLTQRIQHC
jgi:hypothetical protein